MPPRRKVKMWGIVVFLLTLGALVAPPAAVATPPVKGQVIVGFNDVVDASVGASYGGTMTAKNDHLRIAGFVVANPSAFISGITQNPHVAFAEMNGVVRAGGTGWDSAGWDSAGWDGTGWTSAGWDATNGTSAGWDSAGWDGTGWTSAGWDSAGWDSAGWDSTGWSSTNAGWSSINWSSAGWDGAGWNGLAWDGAGGDSAGWDGSLWNATWLKMKATGAAGTDPLSRYQWGWQVVNASEAAARVSATPARTVCVVDSGVDYLHPDLAASMWTAADGTHGYDFVNEDADPMDDGGHGTHVAGIAAAATANGLGVAGAGGTRIMAVKTLAANGTGTELDLARGIEYCLDHGARVVSLSLSTDQDSQAVHGAVVDAVQRGAVVVAAAGNTGASGAIRYPAAYPEVIAVGAIMPDGRWAPFSTVARYVDVAAPGFAIVSTYLGGSYVAINGTSMATPFVSAAAAMVLAADPALNATGVKVALARTAMDLGPPGPDAYTGFGMVRADAAVQWAMR